MRTRLFTSLLVIGSLLAACGGDDQSSDTPPEQPTTTTVAPTTTGAATTTTVTTLPATTVPATTPVTTVPACEPFGSTAEQIDHFPDRMSALIGGSVRTGAHECFERVVIEFLPGTPPTPGPFPGWWTRYADGPITLGQTDDQFVDLLGDATLLVTVSSWMYAIYSGGESDPTDIFPTDVSHILELRLIDNFEGVHTWAIGLDQERNYQVTQLADPARLVIDIQI